MTLDGGSASAVVGAAAVLVAAWGGWFSTRAARRGPEWAQSHLRAGRAAPWLLAAVGVATMLSVEPVWVGLGILYIAAVTGLLMRQVRRRLEAVEAAYGFDEGLVARSRSGKLGAYLLGGGAVLAVVGAVDLAVRGWDGTFALALAAVLIAAGLVVRRG